MTHFQQNIILIGYMGCGKTTVGKALSTLTGWTFIDCDDLIAEREGCPCSDILRTQGEPYFREVERQTLLSISAKPPIIIATGGGMPCYQDNMQLINQLGTSIYLHRTPEDLALRLELTDINTRPMLHGKTGQELIQHVTQQLNQRLPYYQMAHHTISGQGDDDQNIARQIYQQIINSFL